jgi:hypothetical protein
LKACRHSESRARRGFVNALMKLKDFLALFRKKA